MLVEVMNPTEKKIFEVMKGNTHKPKVKMNEKSYGKPEKKGIKIRPCKLICFANSIYKNQMYNKYIWAQRYISFYYIDFG